MITPISKLVGRTRYIRKINKFLGSTVDYGQNQNGDWTVMTTSYWPFISTVLIMFIWATGLFTVQVIFFIDGKDIFISIV